MSTLESADFYFPHRYPAIYDEPSEEDRIALLEDNNRELEDWLRQLHITAAAPGGVTDHGALTGLLDDDHPQYQLRAEKGAASGYAALDSGVHVPVAQLGSGVADATKYLRGDGTWAVVAAGGGLAILSSFQAGTVAYGVSVYWTTRAAVSIAAMRSLLVTPSATAPTTTAVIKNGATGGTAVLAPGSQDTGVVSFGAVSIAPGDKLQTFAQPGIGAAGLNILLFVDT